MQAHRDFLESAPAVTGLPPAPGRTQRDLDAASAAAFAALDRAAVGAAAGDIDTVMNETGAIPSGSSPPPVRRRGRAVARLTPGRAAEASLNVSIVGAQPVEVGYGSVWVNQSLSPHVVRVDADTGELHATIEVPTRAAKLQPADGRMVVRTADSCEAIDPATNTIAGGLLEADVWPNADRPTSPTRPRPISLSSDGAELRAPE